MFRELCGGVVSKNVVFVTNMWDGVTLEDGEYRENELSNKFFKPVLDLGAQMVRYHNTTQSAHEIIRRIVVNPPVVLQIQRELVDERKDIVHTAAGGTINRELNNWMRRYKGVLECVKEEIKQALKEKDEKARQELEEDMWKLQKQVEGIKDSNGMALNYAAEKERMEAKVKRWSRKEM